MGGVRHRYYVEKKKYRIARELEVKDNAILELATK